MELSHQAQKPVVIQSGLPGVIKEDYEWDWINDYRFSEDAHLEIFDGYPTDKFKNPLVTWAIDRIFIVRLISLGEMLSDYFHDLTLVYDGTDESIIRLVEADRNYWHVKCKQQGDHPLWMWGKHETRKGGWGTSEDGQLMISEFGTDVRTARAYINARSARFEHGETPNASA